MSYTSSSEFVTEITQLFGQNVMDLIRPYIGYLTFGIDIGAGMIIGISAFMAMVEFFRILRKSKEEQTVEKETMRLWLARGMLLALDFEVGSDILKTILVPSVTELTILAVVVGIRIVLIWSLSKEMDRHTAGTQGRGARLERTQNQSDQHVGRQNSSFTSKRQDV